ncbi:P-type conjugative transfer protein TrbJ [Lautropia mirabilis]
MNTCRHRVFISAIAVATAAIMAPTQAGIPVVDAGNLAQNILTALNTIEQYKMQGQQYYTQLQQYKAQIEEVESWVEGDYSWESVQQVLDNITDITRKIDYFDNTVRDINGYLEKFQDIAYYEKSPCFTSAGCSDEERELMEKNRLLASENQNEANKAMFQTLQLQKKQIQDDTQYLESERQRASTVTHQKAILAHANQLAMEQNKQLLQIRALLIAQQEVVSAEVLKKNDEEAKRQAAHKNFTEKRILKTTNPKNVLEYGK